MKTKSPITQYHAGSRDPDVVQAYRDYHREYERKRYEPRGRKAAVIQNAAIDELISELEAVLQPRT